MKSRILATAAISIALVVTFASPAFATQAYTGALSANSSAPGGSLTYNSDNTGQPDGTTGTFDLSGDSASALGTVVNSAAEVTHTIKVGTNGQLTFSVTIPKDAKVGSVYQLAVQTGKFSDRQSIKIVGVPASAPISHASAAWIAIPIAIVIVALLLVLFFVLARRRRRAAA